MSRFEEFLTFHEIFASLDINECMYGTDDCTEYEDCVNSLGSFTCYCKPGYVRNEAGYCEGRFLFIKTINPENTTYYVWVIYC